MFILCKINRYWRIAQIRVVLSFFWVVKNNKKKALRVFSNEIYMKYFICEKAKACARKSRAYL
jgi:hypothetical protein